MSIAPHSASGRKPLIPISDHGDERHLLFGHQKILEISSGITHTGDAPDTDAALDTNCSQGAFPGGLGNFLTGNRPFPTGPRGMGGFFMLS
jgi:hypothetical protein